MLNIDNSGILLCNLLWANELLIESYASLEISFKWLRLFVCRSQIHIEPFSSHASLLQQACGSMSIQVTHILIFDKLIILTSENDFMGQLKSVFEK